MKMQFVFLMLLGLFLVLHGVFAVTNLRMSWGPEIMGFAALLAGLAAWWTAWETGRRE